LVTGIVIAIAVIASWAPSRKAASSAVELRN